jgi:peptide/nickel transport system substrate-binding protein
MDRREKTALCLLALLVIVNFYLSFQNFYSSHSVVAPAFGGTYIEGMLGQPAYINPLLAHTEQDLSLVKLVFSGLYKYDGSGKLVPDLAESLPQISPDQKQYTVSLKHNVKWHNGKPFTADDVVFTMQTLQDPAYKSPSLGMWQSTTVQKIDDYTIKFSTQDISGPFVQNLTLPILSQSVWSRVDAQNFLLSDNNLKAVGTGPFTVKEIKKQAGGKVDQITLASFPNFYAGQPKIGTVTIKFYDNETDILNALHSREIDGYGFVSLGSSANLEPGQNNLEILKVPLPQYQAAFFNLNNKILAEDGVRQALSLATDRRKIIRDVFAGQALLPTPPLLLSQGLGKNPIIAPADAATAAKLLDDSGWKIDPKTGLRTKKNQTLELTMVTNDFLLNSKAAESLAAQWRALNIKINLTVVPTKLLTDSAIRLRNFDVLLFPLKFGSDPDPFAFWHSSQIKDPGVNLSGFSDPQVDKLISQARATTNQDARNQEYQQLNAILTTRLPIIWLDQALYTYAVDQKIKGIKLQSLFEPNQRFYDTPNWFIDEKKVWK